MPPAPQLGLVCSKESYRLPVSPQQWGFSTNGGETKFLSAFPIHLARPSQRILAESLLWKQPLSQQVSGVLWRGTLASCRAGLRSDESVKRLNSHQHWVSGPMCFCDPEPPLSHPLHSAVVSMCPRVPTHPMHRQCSFCPYTWRAIMVTASLHRHPNEHICPVSLVLGTPCPL